MQNNKILVFVLSQRFLGFITETCRHFICQNCTEKISTKNYRICKPLRQGKAAKERKRQEFGIICGVPHAAGQSNPLQSQSKNAALPLCGRSGLDVLLQRRSANGLVVPLLQTGIRAQCADHECFANGIDGLKNTGRARGKQAEGKEGGPGGVRYCRKTRKTK